jgi:hypothetical protein
MLNGMSKSLGLSAGLVRAAARLLLLALSVTTLGPVLHGVHDAELHAVFVPHNESDHQYQSASESAGGPLEAEHCVACHFVRTSRGAVSWEPTGLHPLATGHRLFHADGQLVAVLSAAPTPARAPPLA